jgi:Putative adhesin
MKNIAKILIAIFITAGHILFAQDKGDFVVPFSEPSKPIALHVDIKTGSVTIKGSARKDVSVMYTRGNDNDSDHDHERDKEKSSKDGLRRIGGGALDIEASEYQNTVTITSNNWTEGLELIIEVPSTISITAKAYNDGDLEVSNITGDLELTNYNGGISALAISGSVIAQTYNGDIKIVYEKLKPDTPLSYANYNGDIDITFPASLKATLKLKTKQGEIYTGFDGTVVKSNPVQKSDSKSGVYKVVIDDWIKSDIGGGGPEVTMKSYNGDIYVRKK